MKKVVLILALVMVTGLTGMCQKFFSVEDFGVPIVTDSTSTIFIPERYNEQFLSSAKISLWQYYANFIVYNFKTDTYKKLFGKETFIEVVGNPYVRAAGSSQMTRNWFFFLVKTTDVNQNKKIDEKDPSMLYVVSNQGENLKQLTDVTEDIISIDSFEKLGFMLIKIRKDSNKDNSFDSDDRDFYYKRLSLSDLSFGKAIQLK
jgi:hypothetical protein